MKLYYTPRSHFSRKVRLLVDAWGIAVELEDAGNVADSNPRAFADNPLMRVPALVDGQTWIVDSDHIAHYLALRYDPEDQFLVLADDVETLNVRAIMNGIMANEVEVILAQRTGIDVAAHQRFVKLAQAIANGLDWLEANASLIPDRPCYAVFHLVCMWDHLKLYDLVKLEHPRLHELVDRYSELPYVSASRPV